jgi:hypothetical protein
VGADIDLAVLGPLVAGAVAGALLGPQINKRMPNSLLQGAMALIVTGIGIKYLVF